MPLSRKTAADATPGGLPDPRAILNSIGEAVYDWDILSDQLTFGPNTADIPEFAEFASLTSGRAYAERLAPESPSSRFEAVMSATEQDLGRGVAYKVVYGLTSHSNERAGGGKIVWIEDTGRWFAGSNGKPARAHGLVRVITDRYETERRLARQSHYDTLTGALNRAYFVEHIERLLPESARKRGCHAVLLAGIDSLAVLNEAYGYDVGDELIAAVADRLRSELRASDLMARYAGNKFALFLNSCNSEQMEMAAARLLACVEAMPLATKVGEIAASLRIGGVIIPQQGRSAQAALHHAEEALAATRRSGGNSFVAYTPSLVRDERRLSILHASDEIVAALNGGRITLALQPVVFAKTGAVAFYEALARLITQDGRAVLPADIFPVAEKTGLVRLIDHRMLELVVAELVKDTSLRIAINASGATILDAHWPDQLRTACAISADVAGRLTVEITETCAIADLEATGRAIAAMQACGVKVAMDDFGSGHTSFRNLRSLCVDLLKIDGAFIQNLARSEDDRFFVRTLVDLARHLQIPIVAEWVEDADSAAILADWGVDYFQGRHFGEPRAAAREASSASA